MKKTVIALSLGTMLLTGGNAKATDFDGLPIKEKTQVMKTQKTPETVGRVRIKKF